MNHLSDDRLYALAFDGATAGDDEAQHLAGCSACATTGTALRTLAASLLIAGRSLPREEEVLRAYALAATVPVRSPLERVQGWVRALLAVDTRKSVTAGVRGPSVPYRLLYTAGSMDVELLVAPVNGHRRLEGAILASDGDESAPRALVQLTRYDAESVAEVETEAGGRFHFDAVEAGAYRLWIAFADAGDVVIEELEIA